MSISSSFSSAIAVASLMLSPMTALAGPVASGCRTALDTSLDTKSDLAYEKVAGANQGLLSVRLMDGLVQADLGFPTTLGGNQDLIGFGSFDGTGRAQLLAANVSAPNQGLLRILNLTGTALTSNEFPASIPTGFSFVGVADMDGDGDDDIVLVKSEAPNVGLIRVIRMNTDFTVQGNAFPGTVPTGFSILGLADTNDSGRADIILVKTDAPNVGLYRVLLVAADAAAITGSGFPGFVPEGFEAVGVGCFNDDSVADVVVVKSGAPNAGLVRVQLMVSGAASFSGSTFPFFVPAGFAIDAFGNFDGTGGDDIIARKTGAPNAGLNRVFLLTSDASSVADTSFPNVVSTEFNSVSAP